MTTTNDPRAAAVKRLTARREFHLHLAVYLAVNTILVIVWAASGGGFFWPIWPMGGWGIGIVSHAFTVYLHRPISEDDIQAEMRRHQPPGTGTR